MSLCPWCGDALEAVRAAGAEQAMVSGSGPTVVGIWWGLGGRGGRSRRPHELRRGTRGRCVAEPVTAEFAAPSLT